MDQSEVEKRNPRVRVDFETEGEPYGGAHCPFCGERNMLWLSDGTEESEAKVVMSRTKKCAHAVGVMMEGDEIVVWFREHGMGLGPILYPGVSRWNH